MVVRGVYTKAEEKLLAEWRERAESLVGWVEAGPRDCRVASRDLILCASLPADHNNPLYSDDDYAKNTCWGGIIAPPFFERVFGMGPFYWLGLTPDTGVFAEMLIGEEWEIFKPVHVGDSFRIWTGLAKIEDVTRPGEQPERRLKCTSHVKFINQHDEVTAILGRYDITAILPPGAELSEVFRNGEEIGKESRGGMGLTEEELRVKPTRPYVYAPEDAQAIKRLSAGQERRGARPLYWEDVVVGEELKPAVEGPITAWDMVAYLAGSGEIAATRTHAVDSGVAEARLVDPATNIPYDGIQHHISDEIGYLMGSYSSTICIGAIEYTLTRCISNWMGDDGFLRKFTWEKLLNTALGDTIFGRGKVVRKYINDDGEHLIDLDMWLETVRGYVSNVGPATVRLLSKERVFR
jgi:acyl dehydratase